MEDGDGRAVNAADSGAADGACGASTIGTACDGGGGREGFASAGGRAGACRDADAMTEAVASREVVAMERSWESEPDGSVAGCADDDGGLARTEQRLSPSGGAGHCRAVEEVCECRVACFGFGGKVPRFGAKRFFWTGVDALFGSLI